MQPLWLYLHFPQLQLDTLFRDPNTADISPIIILDKTRNAIMQLNQKALDAGLELGMGLATAAMLVPHVQVFPYQVSLEETKLAEIAELLYSVTSDIALFKPNGLLLRIHNMLQLYGDLGAYWQALSSQLRQTQASFCYGTGHTPLAARLYARGGLNQVSDQRHTLKIQLNRYPLTQTDISEQVVRQLHRVGVYRVEQLLAIPRAELAKRFDIDLINYLGKLTGEFQHVIEFIVPEERFSRYQELLFDISNIATLLLPLQGILQQLEQFARSRNQLAVSLQVILYQRDAAPLAVTVGAAQGEYQASRWLKLVELKFENISLDAPVYAVELATVAMTDMEGICEDLFSHQTASIATARLLSLLAARLGERALQQPVLLDDHRPEATFQYRSVTSESLQESLVSNAQLPKFRPSFLLAQPQILLEKVKIIQGPERIATGWWDNKYIERDYFIARTGDGRYYWIYRTRDKQWYVHGVFS